MNTRGVRETRYRLALRASLVVSAAVHGLALGVVAVRVPEPVGGPSHRAAESPSFRVPAIELLRLEEVRERVPPDPVVADAPVVPTVPASEGPPDPRSGEAFVAAWGEDVASAAPVAGGAETPGASLPLATALAAKGPLSGLPLSMRPRLGVRHGPGLIGEALDAPDPQAHDDREEGEGEERRSWWRRLGAKFGIGDGGNVCVPRPEVLDEGPASAGR